MGNAVPKAIKARANLLLKEFPDKMGTDYLANKKAIDSLELPLGKTSRNKIAGFIVRQVKKAAKQ